MNAQVPFFQASTPITFRLGWGPLARPRLSLHLSCKTCKHCQHPSPCLTQRVPIHSHKRGANLLAFCFSYIVRSDQCPFCSLFFISLEISYKCRHYRFPVHPIRYYQHVNAFPNERFGISSKAVSLRSLRVPGFRSILTSPARTSNGGSQFCGGLR